MVTRRLSVLICLQMAPNNTPWHCVRLCDFTWPCLWACRLLYSMTNDIDVLRSTRCHPALKLLMLCILYNLSNHELYLAKWKRCSTTNLPNSWLPSWSTRVVHEGITLQAPKGEKINYPLSKTDLHPRLPLLKPNTSTWGHQTPRRPATGKGPGSGSVGNSDGSHVCSTLWYINFDSCQPRPCEQYFLMFVFVVGHECSSYDNSTINKKNKTGNHALKVFPRSHLDKTSSRGQVY